MIARMRSCGSGSPITPVEDENTRLAGMFSALATAPVTASTDSCPRAPVKALALPELTMIAAPSGASPPEASLAWLSSTQAARVEDRVKAPAIADPGAMRIRVTSVRP